MVHSDDELLRVCLLKKCIRDGTEVGSSSILNYLLIAHAIRLRISNRHSFCAIFHLSNAHTSQAHTHKSFERTVNTLYQTEKSTGSKNLVRCERAACCRYVRKVCGGVAGDECDIEFLSHYAGYEKRLNRANNNQLMSQNVV